MGYKFPSSSNTVSIQKAIKQSLILAITRRGNKEMVSKNTMDKHAI